MPNLVPTVGAQSTLNFGYVLADLAALSFIGLGIEPPDLLPLGRHDRGGPGRAAGRRCAAGPPARERRRTHRRVDRRQSRRNSRPDRRQLHEELLEIEQFSLHFPGRGPLLNEVTLHVDDARGRRPGGRAGSGKSLTTRAGADLFPGHLPVLRFREGTGSGNTTSAPAAKLLQLRRNHASMIFQDPRAGINPVRTVGDFLTETLVRWRGLSRKESVARALTQLEQVGLRRTKEMMRQYPHQLSGGMLQRVMIAAALLDSPELLLCDEPTTALDVTTQAGILELLREQQQARGMGMLFITHDLNLAASLCDRVYVLARAKLWSMARLAKCS